jgi:hypothetical protein
MPKPSAQLRSCSETGTSLLAAPILVPKHLGPFSENQGLGAGVALVGALSAWSYLHVGPAHYVRLGKAFLGALLASWAPRSAVPAPAWAPDAAILAPPVLFAYWAIRQSGIPAEPE